MKKSTIWAIVLLIGAYVICQAVADVGATKIVQLGKVTLPAGTFVFALTFTIRDLIHKRLGKEWARAAIVCAALFNVFQSGYLALAAQLPYPPFFGLGESWTAVFSIVPAITIGSIAAELVSELVDTEVYHWARNKAPQWMAVLWSNMISLPLDSLIFGFLGFVFLPPFFGAEALPFSVAMGIVGGQIIWKAAVTVVSMPAIYLVKEKSLLVE